jgi:hypothetical protein
MSGQIVSAELPMAERLPALTSILLALSACASSPTAELGPVPTRLSGCDAELRAFVAVAKLAKQGGDDWTVYQPAIDAMKDQILDCVQDTSGGAQPI